MKSSLGRYSINHPKFTPDLHNLVLNYCQITHTCFCSFFFFFMLHRIFYHPKTTFGREECMHTSLPFLIMNEFSHNELNLTPLKIRWFKAFHTTCNSVFCNNTEELNIVNFVIFLLNIFIEKGEKLLELLFW